MTCSGGMCTGVERSSGPSRALDSLLALSFCLYQKSGSKDSPARKADVMHDDLCLRGSADGTRQRGPIVSVDQERRRFSSDLTARREIFGT